MRRLLEGEKIGAGFYKDVFTSKENPDLLIANFREPLGNDQVKSAYYLGKIAHILFPDNVPDIHAAFNSNKDQTSTLYLENAHTDKEHRQNNKYHVDRSNGGLRDEDRARLSRKYSIKNKKNPEVKKLLKTMAEKGLEPDPNGLNFGRSEKGKVLYLDTDPGYVDSLTPRILKFDSYLLRIAIEDLPEGSQKQQALNYFERLIKLTTEVKEEEEKSTEE